MCFVPRDRDGASFLCDILAADYFSTQINLPLTLKNWPMGPSVDTVADQQRQLSEQAFVILATLQFH